VKPSSQSVGLVGRAEDSRADLLARWQESGDHQALERLLQMEVHAIKGRIRRQIQHLTSPSQSASDVAQEAAARWLGVRTPTHFQSPAALRAYLWTTALNLLRLHVQQDRIPVHTGALDVQPLVADREEEQDLARERSVALHLGLGLLRPDERRILELYYFEGQDSHGVARALGIEPENARMRLVRARRALTRKLQAWKAFLEEP